jgi:4-aminobutyrate aminotransferase
MEQWTPGAHGNTYGGNPVCCAAALATIELVEQKYVKNAARVGSYLLDKIRDLAERQPMIGDVRGKGLMFGVEFVEDRGSKKPAKEFVAELIHEAFYNGLLLLPCGVSTIRFMPPLMLSQALADEAMEIIETSIEAVAKRL